MYYENKRSFYIRQYGPPVIAILISVVLIAAGLYMAARSLEKDLNKQQLESLVAENNTSVNISETMPDKLLNLKSFTKSDEYTVYGIRNDGGIVIETSKNEYFKINLIGVESSTKYTSLKEKMEEDLLNKKIKVEFDNSKLDKNQAYAYIYLNNELYNTKILKNGYAILRVERKNVDKLNLLLQAETEARRAKVGVWEA